MRTTAIDMLVDRFLAAHADKPVQIVSLGAGSDTRFFRLVRRRPELAERLVYHELDFAATTVKKIAAIERTPAALALLEGMGRQPGAAEAPSVCLAEDKTTLASASYHVHAVDLRGLASALPDASSTATTPPPGNAHTAPPHTPSLPSLSSDTPTLLLAECCLTYLDPPTSTSLLTHFTQTLIPAPTPLAIILYEPLYPHDAFGRTMRANLASRGIALPGLEAVPTLTAHAERLRGVGFVDEARGCEVGRVWAEWVGPEEKERLRRVEGLDEEEEWVLLAGHYGVVWGARGMVLGNGSGAGI